MIMMRMNNKNSGKETENRMNEKKPKQFL